MARRSARRPGRLEVLEVEGLLHLVRAHPVGELLERFDPRLGTENPIVVRTLEHFVPVPVDLVHAGLGPVRCGRRRS